MALHAAPTVLNAALGAGAAELFFNKTFDRCRCGASCRRATTRHGECSCRAAIRRGESSWHEVRPDAAGVRTGTLQILALTAEVEAVARAIAVLGAGVLRVALANDLLALGTALKRQRFANLTLVRYR